jgi:hypothetical protein
MEYFHRLARSCGRLSRRTWKRYGSRDPGPALRANPHLLVMTTRESASARSGAVRTNSAAGSRRSFVKKNCQTLATRSFWVPTGMEPTHSFIFVARQISPFLHVYHRSLTLLFLHGIALRSVPGYRGARSKIKRRHLIIVGGINRVNRFDKTSFAAINCERRITFSESSCVEDIPPRAVVLVRQWTNRMNAVAVLPSFFHFLHFLRDAARQNLLMAILESERPPAGHRGEKENKMFSQKGKMAW